MKLAWQVYEREKKGEEKKGEEKKGEVLRTDHPI
jgi:hypothetical protein